MISWEQYMSIKSLKAEGLSERRIAEVTGHARKTVSKVLKGDHAMTQTPSVFERHALNGVPYGRFFLPRRRSAPGSIISGAADTGIRAELLHSEPALQQWRRQLLDDEVDGLAPRPPLGRRSSATCRKAL